MLEAIVISYSKEQDIGTIKDTENGAKHEFTSTHISKGIAPDLLVGKTVNYKVGDKGNLFITPQQGSILGAGETSTVKLRFRGNYSVNDAVSASFGMLLLLTHIFVFLFIIFLLVDGEFYRTLGFETFGQRLQMSCIVVLSYVLSMGLITTFVAINEHLREINRRL